MAVIKVVGKNFGKQLDRFRPLKSRIEPQKSGNCPISEKFVGVWTYDRAERCSG